MKERTINSLREHEKLCVQYNSNKSGCDLGRCNGIGRLYGSDSYRSHIKGHRQRVCISYKQIKEGKKFERIKDKSSILENKTNK